MRSLIEQAVDAVVRCCDPDEVRVFGSHAKGLETIDSDLDLLAIGEFGGRKALIARELRSYFRSSLVPVDVLLVAAEELAAAPPTSFLGSVARSAVIAYRRDLPVAPSMGSVIRTGST